jgi:glycosyltransferase involved in cell wall biosynthesis
VDLSRFKPGARQQTAAAGELKVISVGRQFDGKDPSPLLHAVAGMEQVSLTLVGDGPLHDRLHQLSRKLRIEDRVTFIAHIGHDRLPDLYRDHDLFAINITHPGVCIPVLEAAASGLPVVINRPRWETRPEVIGELAEVVDGSTGGYLAAFSSLGQNPAYRLEKGDALRELSATFDGVEMERREADIYGRLSY